MKSLLVFLAAIVCPLLLTAAEPHSAITPAARSGAQMQRHLSFNQKVQANQGNIDLIFVGDSITQGWEGAGKSVWECYYSDRKALNLGIGGDRTQHVLWRLDNGNVDGISPKAAVVMIGTNNSGDNRNTASEMVDGVRAVVAKLREKLPQTRILLLGIFPRGEDFNPQRGKILQVNQAIRRLHDGEWVHYLDIGHHFLQDDGSISKEIMPDFLHFTPRGYQIWAESIEKPLAGLLGQEPKTESIDPTGEWTWSMKGPEDRMVEARLVLKRSGAQLTGSFEMRENRELEIEQGKAEGNRLEFIVKRNRPSGGTLIYHMTATVHPSRLDGTVRTRLDEEEITREWQAVRK